MQPFIYVRPIPKISINEYTNSPQIYLPSIAFQFIAPYPLRLTDSQPNDNPINYHYTRTTPSKLHTQPAPRPKPQPVPVTTDSQPPIPVPLAPAARSAAFEPS